MTIGKLVSQDKKVLQISCLKWSQMMAKTFFFWSSPDFGEKSPQFLAKTFFVFLSSLFSAKKYIVSTKLFVKLVKAAKRPPMQNFTI